MNQPSCPFRFRARRLPTHGTTLLALCAALLAAPAAAAPPVLQIERPVLADPRQAAVFSDPVAPVLRVAQDVLLALSLNDGRWRVESTGRAHWELRFETTDATHVGLALDHWQFPAGAAVTVYNRDGVRGPFGPAQRAHDGRLWIPALPGGAVTLGVSMPAAALSEFSPGELTLQYGTHDVTARTSQVGQAGACHIHTACPQGDAWRDDIAAAARIMIGNSLLCSAVLVNNTAEDGDPLLLTADHCGIGDGPNRFPASSVVALFNFESRRCDGKGAYNADDWLAGATLLYRHTDTDTALIRLNSALPEHFDVHFSGWDARNVAAQQGAGMHHPAGDLKRISLYDTPLQASTVNVQNPENGSQRLVQAWRVEWAEGATEPGSSGSALWSQNRQVVGVLSGGSSSCNGSQASDGTADFYGRLSVAWDSNGHLGTPLHALLDKTGSGVLTLVGRSQTTIGEDDPAPPPSDGGNDTPNDADEDDSVSEPPPGGGGSDDGDAGGNGDAGSDDGSGSGNASPSGDDGADDPASEGSSGGSSGGHALTLLLLATGLLLRRRTTRG